MAPHYKLVYFPIKARGEIIRRIFAYAGVEFEDHHVKKEEWRRMRKEMPFRQLPVLYVDGKPLAQSHAIARYLAREFGINGQNPWEEAQVNALADQFNDYQEAVQPFFLKKDSVDSKEYNELFGKVFNPHYFRNYEFFTKCLNTNQSGYLVGKSLTWVDLLVAEHSAEVLKLRNGSIILENFMKMVHHEWEVNRNPNIKKWIEKSEKAKKKRVSKV